MTEYLVLVLQADKTKSRGYMFVEYESHKAAALARRKLSQGILCFWENIAQPGDLHKKAELIGM